MKIELKIKNASNVISMAGGCPKGSEVACGIMYRAS